MILSTDHRVAIITPTKTGTRSLESALTKASDQFEVSMPRHGLFAPDEYEQVFVTFRNPYARLASMYGYGRRSTHGWFIGRVEGTFETFVRSWVKDRDSRKPNDWTSLMSEYVKANYGRPTLVFRLEDDSVSSIQRELKRLNYKINQVDRHINKSTHDSWESMWTKTALSIVGNRLDPDLTMGNYRRIKR